VSGVTNSQRENLAERQVDWKVKHRATSRAYFNV